MQQKNIGKAKNEIKNQKKLNPMAVPSQDSAVH